MVKRDAREGEGLLRWMNEKLRLSWLHGSGNFLAASSLAKRTTERSPQYAKCGNSPTAAHGWFPRAARSSTRENASTQPFLTTHSTELTLLNSPGTQFGVLFFTAKMLNVLG